MHFVFVTRGTVFTTAILVGGVVIINLLFHIIMVNSTNNNDELRLQEYQEQLLRIISEFPTTISHIDWLKMTDGFDPSEINFFIMGTFKREVMERLIKQLNADWAKSLEKPEPRIFEDQHNCDIIKYGGEENPVRFSTFLEETRRVWINREIDCLMI